MIQPKEPENKAGKKARQQYLEQARKVIGEADLDYHTLYQRFAQNDWAAIKLDDAIALTSLKAGYTPKQVVGLLHQGPYLQYQVHDNKVPLAPMSQYVRSTVMKAVQQVQKSQGAEPRTQGRSHSRQQNLDLE
ncbi:MAG: hypothetical protein F6K19_15185 [Cyanothece sp. SIO1E1]|nr:hypothetical protein [Cyanothece sp. SIO1E1]